MRTFLMEDDNVELTDDLRNHLARLEDVDEDELKKKFLADVDHGEFEALSLEEIDAEEQVFTCGDILSFLDIEPDEIEAEIQQSDDPLNSLTQILNEEYQNNNRYDPSRPELAGSIKEANARFGITQLDGQEIVEDDDPLLTKQFAEERDRLARELQMKRERRLTIKTFHNGADEPEILESSDPIFGSTKKQSEYRSTNGFGTGSVNPKFKKADKETTIEYSENDGGKKSKIKREMDPEALERRNKMYSKGTSMMLDIAIHSEKKKKRTKKKPFGKRKRSFKGMVAAAKEWMASSEVQLLAKIGTLFTLQLGIAMMNNQVEFDNALQLLMFLGAMMGTLWISRELKSLGVDPRRVSMF